MSEDDDLLAAELTLGLLDGDERASALRRLISDPTFAERVAHWQEAFAPLILSIPGIAPSETVWRNIEAALDERTNGKHMIVVWMKRWRAAAITASAIAASLVLFLTVRPGSVSPPAVPAPALVAQLGPSDAKAVLLARYDQRKAELTIAPATISAEGHSAELWVIPEGGKPHSLGLVGPSGITKIVVPPALRNILTGGATLAMSLEPVGGSPTGQPTGAVVAVGKLTKI